MDKFLRITAYTILDLLRNRSLYVLLAVAVGFVLLIRGCYGASSVVNGQQLDGATVAWQVAKIVFQVISMGVFFMVALLAMKLFSRDLDDGGMVMVLSRPVQRWQYVGGRIAGTWLLSTVFMVLLHATIFLTVWAKTGGASPQIMTASAVCSINLLFIILCTSLLALYMPDFVAALFTMGITMISFFVEGAHQLLNSEMIKPMVQNVQVQPSLWQIVFPKIFSVQLWAGSIISDTAFSGIGPVHPVVNVAMYCAVIGVVLVVGFERKEV